MSGVSRNRKFPGERSLFKYLTAPTTVAVLDSGKVRFSSPLLFNDPFDVQSGLHFDFDVQGLPEMLLSHLEQYVLGDQELPVDSNNPWCEFVQLMRKRRDSEGFPRGRLRELGRDNLEGAAEAVGTFQRRYREAWWDDFLPRLRVFSVTEAKDNLLMWAHYAKDRTGAVLELRSLPALDNALSVAEQVEYRDTPPVLLTRDECLNSFLPGHPIDSTELYYKYARFKSTTWAYENEWRVWDLLPSRQPELYEDRPFLPQELAAVYLGARMSEEAELNVLNLVATKYPNTLAFKARKSTKTYSLEFDAVSALKT
jgi:hypothetical protein